MKKTEYFIAPHYPAHDLTNAIKKAVEARDNFIKTNLSVIAKIDNEDIKITYFNANMAVVSVVIVFTYYQK